MRSTEVKLVADLLSYDAESVEDLAKAVITQLDEDRKKRDNYVVRVNMAGNVFGLGPYPTENKALAAARVVAPGLDDDELKRSVARLLPPVTLDEVAKTKPAAWCVECQHPMVAHDWPKSKIPGCVVKGCLCGKPESPPVP